MRVRFTELVGMGSIGLVGMGKDLWVRGLVPRSTNPFHLNLNSLFETLRIG